jgi:hypothetical protein
MEPTNRASSVFEKHFVSDAQLVTTSEQDRVSDFHCDSVTTSEHDLVSDFHCDPDIAAMKVTLCAEACASAPPQASDGDFHRSDGDFHRHRTFGDGPKTEPDSQEPARIPLGKGQDLTDLHTTRSRDGVHPRIARETGCAYTPGRAATGRRLSHRAPSRGILGLA